MEIEEFINTITNTCKEKIASGEWSKLEAMRYAYVTLGKELSKSTKFFFSLEGKLGNFALTVDQMRQIHNAPENYEVTCYVSAKMLKKIYSQLGITCELLQSAESRPYIFENKSIDIKHTYLYCHGENNENYFLSLNSDLVNIKMGFKTEHFAGNVPYHYKNIQTYAGPERESVVLDEKQLYEIDKKIGYTFKAFSDKTQQIENVYATNDPKHDAFGTQRNGNEDYLMLILDSIDNGFSSGLTNLFRSFKNKDGSPKENYSQLTKKETRLVERYIFDKCFELIKSKLQLNKINQNEYNEFLKLFDTEKLDVEKLKQLLTNFIKANSAGLEMPNNTHENPYAIATKMTTMLDIIETFTNPELIKTLSKKQLISLGTRQRELKKTISKLCISQEQLDYYTNNKTPTNLYLHNKIKTMMDHDFECYNNANLTQKGNYYLPTICTDMQTIEQATFIKTYLRTILRQELPNETAFLSRIMFSTIITKDGENRFEFLIHVKNDDPASNEPQYSFIYNPQNNTIVDTHFLSLKMKYHILSKTVMDHFNQKAKPKGPVIHEELDDPKERE